MEVKAKSNEKGKMAKLKRNASLDDEDIASNIASQSLMEENLV